MLGMDDAEARNIDRKVNAQQQELKLEARYNNEEQKKALDWRLSLDDNPMIKMDWSQDRFPYFAFCFK